MPQYTVNNSTESSNNGNAFDAWNSNTATDDRSQLLAWLSPLSPGMRHWNIQERRVNNIGERLLETEELRRWYAGSEGGEAESAVLFCYGDPGVGKSFISSLVVDRLCDLTSRQNTAVSCFYLDFAARKEQSATNVLGSMLKQMVGGMERIPDEISRVFQQQKATIGGLRPQLVNIVKMIQCIASSRRIFMCLDALDECSGVERFRLLDSLKEILDKYPETRIFATGRPHIRAEIISHLAGQVASVSVDSNRGDITRYLRFRLGHDETPYAMDESLAAEILGTMSENMSDIFRLVSLNLEAVLLEPTIYLRRERLRKTNDGLGWGEAYGTTIERIKAQDGGKTRLGMAALMWVGYAERTLRADELCHALAVQLGSNDFNGQNIPSIWTLVDCCQGLITVEEETSTVRLTHLTVKEYLSTRPDIFGRPHAVMAEICLTYLNSKQVADLSADASASIHDKPFLGYCSIYWGVHAKRELSNSARSLALELFREYNGHISSKLLLEQVEHQTRLNPHSYFVKYHGRDSSSSFSGLHCASFFGIVDLVAALIEMGCYNINERDTRGSNPLAWAARNGHEEVVKMLLQRREVCPDQSDYSGLTPLSHAAWEGHGEVVKMLLEQPKVYPDKPDDNGRTPLSYASQGGHEMVVKILLELADVSPEGPGHWGQTPISYAAQSGHEGVVKILLELVGVSPDRQSDIGQTPLSYAAQGGHEGVVQILLSRKEVDPGKPDHDGMTPLAYAACYGHEAIVKMLLAREEVNPDQPTTFGETPLLYAARYGRKEVVEILLGREEVMPDRPDEWGRTPLSNAAENGHQEAVRILLGRKEVNPGRLDEDGKTPLIYAVSNSHKEVVALLEAHQLLPPSPT